MYILLWLQSSIYLLTKSSIYHVNEVYTLTKKYKYPLNKFVIYSLTQIVLGRIIILCCPYLFLNKCGIYSITNSRNIWTYKYDTYSLHGKYIVYTPLRNAVYTPLKNVACIYYIANNVE
jgi:hypothetical protein